MHWFSIRAVAVVAAMSTTLADADGCRSLDYSLHNYKQVWQITRRYSCTRLDDTITWFYDLPLALL